MTSLPCMRQLLRQELPNFMTSGEQIRLQLLFVPR